jgi:hypothetical protein
MLESVDVWMFRPDSGNETIVFDCGPFSKAKLHCDGMMDFIGPTVPHQFIVFAKIVERISKR